MCAIDARSTIETPRLRLRTPVRADAERIARFAADYDIARMTTRMPWPYGRQDAEGFLERQAQIDLRRDRAFAVDLPGEGLIGVLGFFTPPKAPLELGYWIAKPFWGRGFATEAARAALAWAQYGWGKRMVTAGHFADNPRSGEVLVKAGFLYTGVVQQRDSIARGEPAATRMMVWLA